MRFHKLHLFFFSNFPASAHLGHLHFQGKEQTRCTTWCKGLEISLKVETSFKSFHIIGQQDREIKSLHIIAHIMCNSNKLHISFFWWIARSRYWWKFRFIISKIDLATNFSLLHLNLMLFLDLIRIVKIPFFVRSSFYVESSFSKCIKTEITHCFGGFSKERREFINFNSCNSGFNWKR